MILLYPSTEKDFNNNGIGSLSDAISCTVTEERNGMYELEMEYPVSGIHYEDIQNRSVILAKPDPYREPQPFRIYRITKPLSGRVIIYAQHISYDLSGVAVSPFSAGSCTAALSGLKSQSVPQDNPFTFWTDKSTAANFTVEVPSSLRSLLGGVQGSILDVYGGEYEFDRWTVKLWNQRGRDRGVTIRYGKNLTSLEQDENISNVATGVYPYWKGSDGVLVEVPGKVVNAPGTYDFERIIPLDLTSEFQEQPTPDQLKQKAESYIKNNSIGIPSVSLSVAFQPLEQTEEYKDLALLERVNLCDTVTVEYPKLGVAAAAKCVKTVYDALKNRYISIELGEARTNIADTISNQQKEIEAIPLSSAFQEAVQNATNWITNGQKGEMVAIKKNGRWVEIASLDTGDIATAQSVWRWNNGGFGHSSNGYNGDFSIALTADGKVNASLITVGVLIGNIIKAGRIQGTKANGPYFDLDANGGKGELAASVLRGVEDGTTTTARIGVGTYVEGTTYEGFDVSTTSGAGGGVTIAIEREQSDYTLSNKAEISAGGNLTIRSQSIASNPGGNNSISMQGNSTTGEGTIAIYRGTHSGRDTLLYGDSTSSHIGFNGNDILWGDSTQTLISLKTGDISNVVRIKPSKIQFVTGGYARASIEDSGAYFGDLYTNGVKVTSDRRKKENISALKGSALDMVRKAKVYGYTLKETGNKHTGIMYDEAPECIRSDGDEKAVDLYGMISLVWKGLQELDERLNKLERGAT